MKYAPAPLPKNPDDLSAYLAREFAKIRAAFNSVHSHDILHAEPDRPEDGMIVYADGTDWNPGSGEGLYERNNGAWVKL